MPKHRRFKRVKPSEEREVFDLLERGKTVPAIVRETGISRSKVYQLKSKAKGLALKYTSQALKDADLMEILERVRYRCASGEHDYKLENYTTAAVLPMWRNTCQFCGREEASDILMGTYYMR